MGSDDQVAGPFSFDMSHDQKFLVRPFGEQFRPGIGGVGELVASFAYLSARW